MKTSSHEPENNKHSADMALGRPANPVHGWGIDADPKNDPTYPMRHREAPEKHDHTWQRPVQQPLDTEVLHSIERPSLSAVYGTSAPPTGLSGMLRRQAFKSSEGTYGHWLLLLMADRINALEGIVADLRHGHVPNICAERGMKAQWKHDKPAIAKKLAVAAAIGAVGVLLISRKRR